MDGERTCFPQAPLQSCLLIASVVKIHDYSKEKGETAFLSLPPTTSDICSPPPQHFLLHPSIILTYYFPYLFSLSPSLPLSFSLPLSNPQRSVCAHLLCRQCEGDNEVSEKRGLGGVVGIIPAVETAHRSLRKDTRSAFHLSPTGCLGVIQLAYWDGCCGPREATWGGLTLRQARHLGDAWRFIL